MHYYSLGNVLLLIIAHGSMPADRDRSMIDELRQKVVDLTEQLTQERAKVKQVSYLCWDLRHFHISFSYVDAKH